MGGVHPEGSGRWHHHPHQHRGPGAHTGALDHIYSPKHHNGSFKAAGLFTFMGAPYCPPERDAIRETGAKVAFLGVPYDEGNVARPGSSGGPQGVREASTQYFPYLFRYDIDLLTTFRVVDCGDVPTVSASPERSHQYIYDYVTECLEGGAKVLLCGGDHSVPIPAARALSDHHRKGRIGYCQYDCHIDAAPDWGGVEITNCSGMSRACELPNCSGESMAHVGSRNGLNPKDWMDFCIDNGIKVYRMWEVIERGIAAVTHEAMQRCWQGVDSIYFSIDTDCLDSACAPGTTAPEPGGIKAREILEAVRVAGTYGQAGIIEISELCPVYDSNNITSKLACCILYEYLGACADAERKRAKGRAVPAEQTKVSA